MMDLILSLIAGGATTVNAIAALGEDFITGGAETVQGASHAILNLPGMSNLLIGFFINLLFVGIVVRGFYYPKCKKGEYFFTFILIAISIFLLIYLLGGIKLKTGFALGLFAIFSIIRYRTEQVSIREMTYLFIIIAMSAINGLVMEELSYSEMFLANLLFIASIWVCESNIVIKHLSYKIIKYDNIALITPDKEAELIEDLKKRTGLDIVKVEVGGIDFLKDAAIIKMYYRPTNGNTTNSVDTIIKAPSDEFKIKQ
jgi:hypothetical protein